MDIGVVLQTTPPAARVIDLAKRADVLAIPRRAQRMGRVVVFADRAQDQPGFGEFQHGPDAGAQRQRQVDHQVVVKEHRAKEWDVGQRAKVQFFDRRGADAHIALPQQ